MKVALLCGSILLQKSLENYLGHLIVQKESAEVIITDKLIQSHKPIFIINHSSKAHLQIPFTKTELLSALQEFYTSIHDPEVTLASKEEIKPYLEKLNKKHHQKIAKLARKIS